MTIYASINWISIGSGNGLSTVRRQALTWTNADLLAIGPSGANFSHIRRETQNFLLMKIPLKMSSAKMAASLSRGDELTTTDIICINNGYMLHHLPTMIPQAQWVNSVPPYVRKLHFMYEVIRTSGKYRWNIYRTSSKCRWSIYRTSRKRRGTLRIVHKVERSSPTVTSTARKFSPSGTLSYTF